MADPLVAIAAKATPFVFVQTRADVPALDVQSPEMAGRRAAASVPDEIFVAFVASVEHDAEALERSAQAACETLPAPSPFSAPLTAPAPPLEDESTPPGK